MPHRRVDQLTRTLHCTPSSRRALLHALAGGLALTRLVIPSAARAQTATPAASGELVAIGDRALFLACSGAGSPPVIFESGLNDGAAVWSAVQAELADTTCVCSYDRANVPGGASDPSDPTATPPRLRSAAELVADLHALLAAGTVPGPYVLVGHSIGGLLIRLYAATYPDEVVGLVLVDATHEDNWSGLEAEIGPALWPTAVAQFTQAVAAGVLEPLDLEATARQVRAARAERPLRPMPLVVLTHTQPPDAATLLPGLSVAASERRWREHQADLVTLVPGSRQILAAESGHYIQLEQPALVVDAIISVVAAVRDPATWGTPVGGGAASTPRATSLDTRLSTAGKTVPEHQSQPPVPRGGRNVMRQLRRLRGVIRFGGLGLVGLGLALSLPLARIAQEDSSPAVSATPAPAGNRVDIGDRALFLSCTGTGSPTVVLEAGGGNPAATWTDVQPAIARFTRVCSYDRLGLGQSDPAPAGVRTVQDSVADLHALLTVAEEPGPYVLVGHSLGGLIVRLYASQHPDDVVGLVLVDGMPPDLPGPGLALLPAEQREQTFTIMRGLHPQDPEHLDIIASGVWVMAHPPTSVPTVVLAAGFHGAPGTPPDPRFEELWQERQREQAHVLGARFIAVPEADHFLHQDRPKLVLAAIVEVVAAVREPSTWSARTPEPAATGTPVA